MNPIKIEQARGRVTSLRNRLRDINTLLHRVASGPQDSSSVRDNLAVAIRSIYAVSDDLASVCDEQLTEWKV